MDTDGLKQMQRILIDLTRSYQDNNEYQRMSDASFAKMMRIHPATWNTYINGRSFPDLANALLIGEFISRYQGVDKRNEFLKICGHAFYHRVDDSRLELIILEWDRLDENKKKELFNLVSEVANKAKERLEHK